MNLDNRLFIICFFILICSIEFSFGQKSYSTVYIRGQLIDSISLAPIPYSTIKVVIDKVQSKKIADEEGKFNLSFRLFGDGMITFSAVGYHQRSVELKQIKEGIDLGTIKMQRSNLQLKEVVVKLEIPIVKQEVDRISYDVQLDPEHSSSSVLDLMKKVPLLFVDAEGNIKLKGGTNYEVLMDGKNSGILSNKATDVLRNMPAVDILRVEVITIPPSKYESKGLAGIINIVRKKRTESGYNGSINSAANLFSDEKNASASAMFSYKYKRIGASMYFGLSENQPKETIQSNRTDLTDNTSVLRQYQNKLFRSPYNTGYIESSYEIDSLNLLTVNLNLYNGKNFIASDNSSSLYSGSVLNQMYHSKLNTIERYSISSYSISYEHSFKPKAKQLLSVSYRFSRSPGNLDQAVEFYDKLNFSGSDFVQYNEKKSSEETFQLEYVHPLKNVTIEAGSKLIFRNNESYFGKGLPSVSSEQSDFKNSQKAYALYNSYSFKLSKWNIKAGIRVEKTLIEARENQSPIKSDFLNFVPSIAVQKLLSERSNINFGFTQRISRPGIADLNTFVDKTNPYVEKTGNPSLEPSVSNKIQLSYSKFSKGNFTTGITYSFERNIIQKVSVYDPDNRITYVSFENLGKNKSLGLDLYYQYDFNKRISANFNGNLAFLWMNGVVNGDLINNNGNTGSAYLSANYRAENDLTINSSFGYERGGVALQELRNSNTSFSIGLNKGFFKKSLNVSVTANNPFTRYRILVREISGDNFLENQRIELYYRNFNIRISYKFGKLKNKIKLPKRKINNDDLNGN